MANKLSGLSRMGSAQVNGKASMPPRPRATQGKPIPGAVASRDDGGGSMQAGEGFPYRTGQTSFRLKQATEPGTQILINPPVREADWSYDPKTRSVIFKQPLHLGDSVLPDGIILNVLYRPVGSSKPPALAAVPPIRSFAGGKVDWQGGRNTPVIGLNVRDQRYMLRVGSNGRVQICRGLEMAQQPETWRDLSASERAALKRTLTVEKSKVTMLQTDAAYKQHSTFEKKRFGSVTTKRAEFNGRQAAREETWDKGIGQILARL